jgi:hypothetical protein
MAASNAHTWRHQLHKHGGINCASIIMAASIAQTCLNQLRTHYHDHIDCTNMLALIAHALT